jgi:hypothetical protein
VMGRTCSAAASLRTLPKRMEEPCSARMTVVRVTRARWASSSWDNACSRRRRRSWGTSTTEDHALVQHKTDSSVQS